MMDTLNARFRHVVVFLIIAVFVAAVLASAKWGCLSRDVVAAGSASRWFGEITETRVAALPAWLGASFRFSGGPLPGPNRKLGAFGSSP